MRHLLRAALFAAVATVAARAQTSVNIDQIMTNLPNSPYLNQSVKVTGVVVGVVNQSANPTLYTPPGFFIANPNAQWDTSTATAEGMQVETIVGTPCVANVGDLVTVTGTVVGSNTQGTSGPGITGAQTPGTLLTCNVLTTNGTSSVSSTVTLPTSVTSFGELYTYVGMPVANTTLNAISPTTGYPDPAGTGLTLSTGQFWAITGTPTNGHLFKSAGLAADNYYPQSPPAPAKGSSPGIPTWTANPQRLLIDTSTLGGLPIDVGAGQVLTCKPGTGLTIGATAGIGIVDYSLGYSRLLLFKTTTCTVSGSIAPSVTSPADSTHFHVGTINLANFQNASSSTNAALYNRRVAKAAIALLNVFGQPDIISVQEVQDLTTLQDIANKINATTGAGTNYQPYISPSTNDTSSLSLGFLVDANTVAVNRTYAVNVADTFTQNNGTSVPLFERPPFVLEAGLLRNGQNYQVEVIDIELTTRVGIDNPTTGINLWQRRGAQSEALSVFANAEQLRGQNLLIAGEYNAYSFSDGFVDPVNIIAGTNPAGPGSVAQYEASMTQTAMYNFVKSITVSNSTYNVIEDGNARSIEHILCSETQNTSASGSIYSYISTVTQPHWTTDYPAIDANDQTIAAGLTARDGFVGAFLIPPVPTTAALSPTSANFGSVYVGNSTTQNFTFTNTSTFPSTVTVKSFAFSGTNATDFSQTSSCTTLNQNATCSITVTFTPAASGARSATLTVTSDSGAEPTLTATLTGTGVDTTATLAPGTGDFGSLDVTGTSTAQTFTFTNTTAGMLNPPAESVLSATTTGPYAVSANTCSAPVAASSTCTVSVVFKPVTVGVVGGSLTVTNTSTLNPSLTTTFTGTGLDTTATLSPLTATFPSTLVGTTSAPLSFTWTNTSTVPLAITGVSTLGNFAVASTTCSGSIAAGATCSVAVTFTPSAPGTRTGSVTVTSSSTLNPTLTATLNGTGTSDLELSATQLNFGNIDLTFSSIVYNVALTNHSPTVVALSAFAITSEYSFTTTCGATISSQQTCLFHIVFSPTALGTQPGTFSFATNDASATQIAIPLTGNGVDFSIALSPTSASTVAGISSDFVATLTPLGGFNSTVATFCTLPQVSGAQCIANSLNNALTAPLQVKMQITTTSPYTLIGYQPAGIARSLWMAIFALLSLVGLCLKRRRFRIASLATMLIAISLANLGCAAKYPDHNANPTAPGTYVYTITVTDNQLAHTATFTQTVRSYY